MKLTPKVVPGGNPLMNDIAQDECMFPFLKEPSAKVKRACFGLSSYSPQLAEPEKYVKAPGIFLEQQR